MPRTAARAELMVQTATGGPPLRATPARHANDVWVLPTARILEIVRGTALDAPSPGPASLRGGAARSAATSVDDGDRHCARRAVR